MLEINTVFCIIILILNLFIIGILLVWMRQDRKVNEMYDTFLKAFDNLTKTIEAYYELIEKIFKKRDK